MADYRLAYLAAGVSSILLLMFFVSVFVVKRREKRQAAMTVIKSFDEDFTIQQEVPIADNYTGLQPPPYSPQDSATDYSVEKRTKLPFEKDVIVDLNEIKSVSLPASPEVDQLKEYEPNGIEIIMNGSNHLADGDRALSSPTLLEDSDDLFEYEAPTITANRRRRSSSLDAIAAINKSDDMSGTALTSSNRRLESVTSIHSVEMLDESSASESQPLERRPSLSDSEVPSRNIKVSFRTGEQGDADNSGNDLDVREETKSF